MDGTPEWLPELELFSDYGGDWERYLDAIYTIFCHDFVDSKPFFRGQRLALKRHPVVEGKEATFWHMTSEGSVESERTPDFRRCQIRWPRPVIENEDDPALKVWSEKRGNENRIHLWFEAEAIWSSWPSEQPTHFLGRPFTSSVHTKGTSTQSVGNETQVGNRLAAPSKRTGP